MTDPGPRGSLLQRDNSRRTRLRKILASLIYLLNLLISSGIGIMLPNSLVMIYHGGFELVYEVWIQWKGSYEHWLPLWVSIMGGGCGMFLGGAFWFWAVVKSGLLSKEERKELGWALGEWGVFGALKKPPPEHRDEA